MLIGCVDFARMATIETTATETGRGADADLGCDGCHRHGAFGADPLFDGDVIDDGEHRVDYMAGAAHDREGPGRDGGEHGDVLGGAAAISFRRRASSR